MRYNKVCPQVPRQIPQANQVTKPLFIMLEKSWQLKKEAQNLHFFFNGSKRNIWKLQASQSHLYVWQDHGVDLVKNVTAHGRKVVKMIFKVLYN